MTATREPPVAEPAAAGSAVAGLSPPVPALAPPPAPEPPLARVSPPPGDTAARRPQAERNEAAAAVAPQPRSTGYRQPAVAQALTARLPAAKATVPPNPAPPRQPQPDVFAPAGPRAAMAWRVTVCPELIGPVERWEAAGHPVPTVFQSAAWLRDWTATLGSRPGTAPLLLQLQAADAPDLQLLLPLAQTRPAGLRLLSSPDDGVSDYHAPLVSDALPVLDPASSTTLWQAICDALAPHGDVLRLRKQLPVLPDGRPNPLAGAPGCMPSDLSGERFEIDDDWDAWVASLPRQARREARRHERLFAGYPQARFERVVDLERGLAVLAQLDAMQRARLASKARFALDQEPWRCFYRRRLAQGLADGSCVLTTLQADGETIAAAYGVRFGTTLTMLRVSFAGERWKACAPGRLLLQHTAREQWQQGCRVFDLSIGRYAYKRSFGCRVQPLVESCTPLSGVGRLATWAWQARRRWQRDDRDDRDHEAPGEGSSCTAACG